MMVRVSRWLAEFLLVEWSVWFFSVYMKVLLCWIWWSNDLMLLLPWCAAPNFLNKNPHATRVIGGTKWRHHSPPCLLQSLSHEASIIALSSLARESACGGARRPCFIYGGWDDEEEVSEWVRATTKWPNFWSALFPSSDSRKSENFFTTRTKFSYSQFESSLRDNNSPVSCIKTPFSLFYSFVGDERKKIVGKN